jgi:hypothetical protein
VVRENYRNAHFAGAPHHSDGYRSGEGVKMNHIRLRVFEDRAE